MGNQDHWAQVAATPWHRRNLRNVEEVLTPPVSRWGKALYYGLVPLIVVAALLSNFFLDFLR